MKPIKKEIDLTLDAILGTNKLSSNYACYIEGTETLNSCCGIVDISPRSLIDSLVNVVDDLQDNESVKCCGYDAKTNLELFVPHLTELIKKAIKGEQAATAILTNIAKTSEKKLNSVLTEICGEPIEMGTNPKTRNKLLMWIYNPKKDGKTAKKTSTVGGKKATNKK